MVKLLLSIVLSAAVVLGQTVVWQRRHHELFLGSITVPAASFNAESVEQAFRRVVAGLESAPALVDLRAYPSVGGVAAECKCRFGIDYNTWRGMFDEGTWREMPTARFVSHHGSALLLFRGADGKVKRRLTGAPDPHIITTASCSAEILHVHHNPKFDGVDAGRPAVTVYLRSTGRPTARCAEALGMAYRQLSGIPAVAAIVRSDAWFVEHDNFPVAYAFDEISQAPSERAYRDQREARCNVSASKCECWEREGLPGGGTGEPVGGFATMSLGSFILLSASGLVTLAGVSNKHLEKDRK